jgi:hypothetical protein
MSIDDTKVEHVFQQVRHALNACREVSLADKQALVERFRVELMIADLSPRRRAVYRAVIDMLEDIIEDELDRQAADRLKGSSALVGYVKRLLDGLS